MMKMMKMMKMMMKMTKMKMSSGKCYLVKTLSSDNLYKS